jgi:HK97 family phage major capsid protein
MERTTVSLAPLARGTAFVRMVRSIIVAKGNLLAARAVAGQYKNTPQVQRVIDAMCGAGGLDAFIEKAAMTAGSTTDSDWAEPLVEYRTLASEFIDTLRARTILGQLRGTRRVPFAVRFVSRTQASTVGWVGQGLSKPVSELRFAEATLGFAKIAGIVVISQELASLSSPAAEATLADDMRDSIVEFMDEQFISPSVSAVANVSPASITNGLTPVVSSGTSVSAINADLEAAVDNLVNAGINLIAPYWVMHPKTATGLVHKRTADGLRAFPEMRATGGELSGIEVIVSGSVPESVSGGAVVALLDAAEIQVADDNQVAIDVGRHASVQLDSVPSAGAQSLVSLWQNNLVGIRAERPINWRTRRDGAVTYIDSVHW